LIEAGADVLVVIICFQSADQEKNKELRALANLITPSAFSYFI
jgi:hypothetical protein